MRLYAWNIEISAALWGGFNLLEVYLRNAFHTQLTDLTGQSDWWNTPLRLSYEQRRKVDDALRFVVADKAESATDGHVVAELTLSFWTGLRPTVTTACSGSPRSRTPSRTSKADVATCMRTLNGCASCAIALPITNRSSPADCAMTTAGCWKSSVPSIRRQLRG